MYNMSEKNLLGMSFPPVTVYRDKCAVFKSVEFLKSECLEHSKNIL